MKSLRCLLLLLFIEASSFAQTWQDTLLLIDKAFTQYLPQNPGCQLSISRNGQLIFSKAWGMADMEHNAPLSVNSILEAGSVSKQFTAAAIILLEQQGKLSLDDDVRKYIPELPDYGTAITLRQMLHHTSGFRDWGSVAELSGWPRSTKFYTNDDALEIIARQKHLNNKPGDEFIYSNSNYNLLAIIVRRVSGITLAAFTKKYIFEPAGMLHTQWRNDPKRIVPNRAIAYSKTDSSFRTEMPNEYVYGNGGLLTTTEDLLKWSSFYQQGKLGTGSLFAKQVQTAPLNNGVMNTYAAGLIIKKVRGLDNISHSGATAGYRAYLETFPELNLSIAVLSNTSQFNINNTAARIRNIFVQDKAENTLQNDSGITLPAGKMNAFAGLYKNERDGSSFLLKIKEGRVLQDGGLPLKIVAENVLKADNFSFEITGDKGMYINFSPVDTVLYTKVSPADPPVKDLAAFAGKYFSEETNSSMTIYIEGSVLMIRFKPNDEYILVPSYADAFKINSLGCNLLFSRNRNNKVVLLKISTSRARNVAFKKME